MNAEVFRDATDALQVFDAHTHLVGDRLGALSFWEIVHYFWFLRELQGAGYPAPEVKITEAERVERFLYAYRKTKGTGMHYAVERIFADLYGLALTDEASIHAAIDAVKDASMQDGWVSHVARKGNIVHTVVNHEPHKAFVGLDNTSVWAPRVDGRLHEAARRTAGADAAQRADIARTEAENLTAWVARQREKGIPAVMTTLQQLHTKTYQNDGTTFANEDACLIFLLRTLCAAAQAHDITLQLFFGVEHGICSVAAPVNRTDRVINLYGLFEDYACRFDLVCAAEVNNMDVVQAAQIFPHVYAGGMWWFNFRPSTYLDAMDKRFEALASCKSYLTISDARCIEWCYGKLMLIKHLAKVFFARKVAEGYVGYEDALTIARDWFYDTPAALYMQ